MSRAESREQRARALRCKLLDLIATISRTERAKLGTAELRAELRATKTELNRVDFPLTSELFSRGI